MNFLALAAILSALGMYALARYVRHAKTAEAIGSVTAIADAAAAYFDASDANQPAGTTPEAAHAMRHFPPPSKASVPPDSELVKRQRYQSTLADWSGSPWAELRFSIPQPQYYAYSFESQGSGVQAKAAVVAHGDLDGNGVSSTYTLRLECDPVNFKAKVGKDIEKIDPEE
jgi:type IV pilus assembly protein PilA